MQRLLLEHFKERAQKKLAHIAALGRLDGQERIYLFLVEMAIRQSRGVQAPLRATLPMSRESIADYLGLNAETVSRLLSRAKKSKLVTFMSPSEYVIPDIGALEARIPIAVHIPENPLVARRTSTLLRGSAMSAGAIP